MALAQVLKSAARRFGYDVRRIAGGYERRTSIMQTYALMKRLGFTPASVIDVGIAHGTEELYSAFPEATYLLVEPLSQFEPAMQAALRRLKGSYVLAAAGSTNGRVTFNLHDDHPGGSSLLKETMGAAADGHEVSVPMIRLDDMVTEKRLAGPMLLKVDVQGAELGVLDGAQRSLGECEVVVLEVSLFRFMKDQPDLHDVVAYMKPRGFVVYDILLNWNRPLDGALGQVDLVFVKEHGPFRRSHAYSSDDQLRALFGGDNRKTATP